MGNHSYVDARGQQPIIQFLREWVPFYFPLLTVRRPRICRQDPDTGARRCFRRPEVGGYNPDPARGAHIEGRAADIYVRVNRADEKQIGDGLFDIFSKHPDELGVETVTWHDRIWNREQHDRPGTYRRYTRGDHEDHIHVAFISGQQRPPILLVYLERLARKLGYYTEP